MKPFFEVNPRSYLVSESLKGESNEVAHIDMLIGPEDGYIGETFADTLSRQTEGHSNLLAVVKPNELVLPPTVTFAKVTIKKLKQVVHMFGDAQAAVALAVGDALKAGKFDKLIDDPRKLRIVVGVFVHWQADNGKKVLEYNYLATSAAIDNAINLYPSRDDVIKFVETAAKHPFSAFADGDEFPAALAAMRKGAGY